MGVNRPKLGQNRGIAQVKFVVAGPQAQVRGENVILNGENMEMMRHADG